MVEGKGNRAEEKFVTTGRLGEVETTFDSAGFLDSRTTLRDAVHSTGRATSGDWELGTVPSVTDFPPISPISRLTPISTDFHVGDPDPMKGGKIISVRS